LTAALDVSDTYSGASSFGSILTVSYSSRLILSKFCDEDADEDDVTDVDDDGDDGRFDGGVTLLVCCFGDDLVSLDG